ncbi:uncharacterized protein LOC141908764 isoform X2 [Tubulanus polymorphus]
MFPKKMAVFILCVMCTAVTISTAADSAKQAVDELIERFWQWRIKEYPLFATGIGEHEFNDRVESLTLATFDRRKLEIDAFLRDIKSIDPNLLAPKDKMNYEVLQNTLLTYTQGHKYKEFTYNAINFLEGPQKGHNSLLSLTPFNTVNDFLTFLKRMSAIAQQIKETQDLLEEAVKVKKTMHAVSIKLVPGQIQKILAIQPTSFYLYTPFNKTLDALTMVNSTYKEQLRMKAKGIIRNEIYGAFRNLSEYISQKYLSNTRNGYGVSSLPGGAEYYEAALKWHLSTDMTPDKVHELGHSEVARIAAEMHKIMEGVQFKGTIKEFINHLKEQPRFFLKTKEDLLNEYRNIIFNRTKQTLPKVFHKEDIPNLPLIVKASESPDEPGGMYYDVSADGKVPGVFVANVFQPDKRPTFDMLALCLHEADPGHHMQISVMLLADLPKFRKFVDYRNYYAVPFQFPFGTSYTEGWGLYAEYLGKELGLYEYPYELFGRYVSEMFRACRLVVDTGLHYKNWTRQEAINYLSDRLTDPLHQIEVEIDRYITWPGQACAYKVGELQILKMRRRAEQALGDKFNVKDFHNIVLKGGSLSLDILHASVNSWIEKTTSSAHRMRQSTFVLLLTTLFMNATHHSLF